MTFVHGHPRDAGWVMSHYRRPRQAGTEQLDLAIPGPRAPQDETDDEADEDDDAEHEQAVEPDRGDVSDAGRRP